MSTLKSMTAYARFDQMIGAHQYAWEVRSVNHRYLDVHFRLPESVQVVEPLVRKALAKSVTRGRVDISLTVREGAAAQTEREVDPERLAQWARWQAQVREVLPEAGPLSVAQLLADSEIFNRQGADSPAEGLLLEGFGDALDGLLRQRRAEGARLQAVLQEKLDGIAEIVASLRRKLPDYEQAHQASWQARVEKLTSEAVDPVRLHQELALLISKADVTEELDRLESHVREFADAMESSKPVGRRLDFLLQEFNREANTLGSKSIHQAITNASVELKVLIDQLREQVQNIE